MRTIEKTFREMQKKNPDWGDYVCLIEAMRGRKFTRKAIRKFFLEHINKDDYDKSDLKTLIDQLHVASNIVEDVHFREKIQLLDVENLKDELRVK